VFAAAGIRRLMRRIRYRIALDPSRRLYMRDTMPAFDTATPRLSHLQ
jgi:hypothetical protein